MRRGTRIGSRTRWRPRWFDRSRAARRIGRRRQRHRFDGGCSSGPCSSIASKAGKAGGTQAVRRSEAAAPFHRAADGVVAMPAAGSPRCICGRRQGAACYPRCRRSTRGRACGLRVPAGERNVADACAAAGRLEWPGGRRRSDDAARALLVSRARRRPAGGQPLQAAVELIAQARRPRRSSQSTVTRWRRPRWRRRVVVTLWRRCRTRRY